VWEIFNEKTKYFIKNEAVEYCGNINGHLVTITSEQENQFVHNLNEYSWIGLSYVLME
jgi:hypothetical protein